MLSYRVFLPLSTNNSSVHCKQAFPRHYAKKYLREEPQSLQRPGRMWPVRFCENNGGKRLKIGWKQFVEDTELEMGDTCLFKLLSTERTMQVYIIQANYRAGLQNDANRRGALAHRADGARVPGSRLLHIAKTEAMEDDVVAPDGA